MARPEETEGVGELPQQDRDRLAKIEINQSNMSDQMAHLVRTMDDMGENMNKMVVAVTKNTESNHHIADRQDKTNDRLDKLEDRTFGPGGLSDQVNDLKVSSGANKVQIGLLIGGATILFGSLATWYFSNASMLSKFSELSQAIQGLQ